MIRGRVAREDLSVQLAVGVGMENGLPVVAALGDVVRRTGNNNSGAAGHGIEG